MSKHINPIRDTEAQWVSIYAQAQGSSHTVCQDRTACIMGQVNVLALADGLSACSLSHLGAEIVTKKACWELSRHYWDYHSGKRNAAKLVKVLQDAVMQQAETEDRYAEMCSTLLFCAVSENTYVIGHIGDGAIAQFGKDSHLISQPMQTPRGGTSTYSILDRDAAKHFRLLQGTLEDLDGFLLTSDGLKGYAYAPEGQALPSPAFKLFYSACSAQEVPPEERNLSLQGGLARYAGKPGADDCSLAVLSRTVLTGHVDYTKANGYPLSVTWPCTCGHPSTLGEIRCGCCGAERSDLYSSVQIDSPGGFFADLQRWLSSDDALPEISKYSGSILDQAQFRQLCRRLRHEEPEPEAPASTPEPKYSESAPPEEYILFLEIEQSEDRTRYELHGSTVKEGSCQADEHASRADALKYLLDQCGTIPDLPEYPRREWAFIPEPNHGAPLTPAEAVEKIGYLRDNSMLSARGADYDLLYALEDAYKIVTVYPVDRHQRPLWYRSILFTGQCIWYIRSSAQEVYFGTPSPTDCRQQLIEALQAAANNQR